MFVIACFVRLMIIDVYGYNVVSFDIRDVYGCIGTDLLLHTSKTASKYFDTQTVSTENDVYHCLRTQLSILIMQIQEWLSGSFDIKDVYGCIGTDLLLQLCNCQHSACRLVIIELIKHSQEMNLAKMTRICEKILQKGQLACKGIARDLRIYRGLIVDLMT